MKPPIKTPPRPRASVRVVGYSSHSGDNISFKQGAASGTRRNQRNKPTLPATPWGKKK